MRLAPHPARWLAIPLLTALVAVAGATPAHAHHTLRHAAGGDFHVGAAVTSNLLTDPHLAPILATQFSSLTPARELRWDQAQPSQGQFNFGPADQIVDFAQQNNQHVYGHTLVWHSQAPGWVQNLSGGAMDAAMQNHIETLMQHYAGSVATWEVVKEALAEDGQLRDSFWLQGLGPNYIAQAFQYARQADPSATLCLDDYDTYSLNVKSAAKFQLAQDLLVQGVPIDCVGFQVDLMLGELPGAQLQQTLQLFANLGLDIWITDLKIRTNLPATQQELQQQANEYAQVFQICRNVSACQGITLWGLIDTQSWIPDPTVSPASPVLWDERLLPTPSYDAVLQQLTAPQQRAS